MSVQVKVGGGGVKRRSCRVTLGASHAASIHKSGFTRDASRVASLHK